MFSPCCTSPRFVNYSSVDAVCATSSGVDCVALVGTYLQVRDFAGLRPQHPDPDPDQKVAGVTCESHKTRERRCAPIRLHRIVSAKHATRALRV